MFMVKVLCVCYVYLCHVGSDAPTNLEVLLQVKMLCVNKFLCLESCSEKSGTCYKCAASEYRSTRDDMCYRDQCRRNPCLGGASCVNTPGSHECRCNGVPYDPVRGCPKEAKPARVCKLSTFSTHCLRQSRHRSCCVVFVK